MTDFAEIKIADLGKCFYKLAEKGKDVFWIRSADFNRQIYISPAFEIIWGRACQELYENPATWIQAIFPDDRELLLDTFNQTPKLEDSYSLNFRVVRPDGKIRYIHDASFPLFNETGECFGYAGVAKDITKDVLHEQELQEAKSRAEIANQAKSNFLAMMSHELRTPLNAILGMAQILRIKGVSPELEECVSVISNAGNSLLALVNDILDFAKLEVGKLSFVDEPIDLQLLISQVIHSLSHQAKEKNLELQLEYPDVVPTLVLSDAKRIRQILINLVGNALKFTEKGYVKIQFFCLKQDKNYADLQIKVVDTGIGISQDKLEMVFEKFSQVDSNYQRKYQGTGLGLAITRELVEKMGGKISLTSELGKGSDFSVVLPFQLQ